MDESQLTVDSEKTVKFQQTTGFQYSIISSATTKCSAVGLPNNCKYYNDKKTNTSYLYYYPNDDTIQYLYETYPKQISPIKGITDEHFIIWMRTASLSKFRKLYGRINKNFKIGDELIFNINANFEVRSFKGHKSLIISTVNDIGGKNKSLGIAYIVIGSFSILLGVIFAIKQRFTPRKFGDSKLVKWD